VPEDVRLVHIPQPGIIRGVGSREGRRAWRLACCLAGIALDHSTCHVVLDDRALADACNKGRRQFSPRAIPDLLAILRDLDLIRVVHDADGRRVIHLAQDPATGAQRWSAWSVRAYVEEGGPEPGDW